MVWLRRVFRWVENHFLLHWNNPCVEVKLNIPILLEKSSTLALEKKWHQTASSLSFFLLPSALDHFMKTIVYFSGKTIIVLPQDGLIFSISFIFWWCKWAKFFSLFNFKNEKLALKLNSIKSPQKSGKIWDSFHSAFKDRFKYILNPPVRIKSESPSNNRLAEWASCQSKSFVGPGQLLRWQSSLVLEVKIADCISSVPWWWCTLSTCSADGAGGPCTCTKTSLSHGTRGPKDNHGAGWRWERGWSLRPRHFWQVLFLHLYPWLPWIISSTFTKANHKGRFTGPCFKYMHLTTYHSCSHLQGTDMWSRLNHAFHRDSIFLKGPQQCALWSPSTSCSIDPSILVVISMLK